MNIMYDAIFCGLVELKDSKMWNSHRFSTWCILMSAMLITANTLCDDKDLDTWNL